jgi:small subunit ribosomal protein S9
MDTAEPKVKAPRAPRAKKAVAKEPKEKEAKAEATTETTKSEKTGVKGEYIFGLGRRKTSIARVRLYKTGSGKAMVNGKDLEVYFPVEELQKMISNVLDVVGLQGAVDIVADANGGGIHGQAESVRLGLARALIILNPTYRKTLKKLGCLTRDPRAKERKKFGLKKARRAPQWSKR